MENQENNQKKYMTAGEAAAVLTETLKDMADRKIPLSRGLAMARVALALSKTIEVADLDERVKFIEQSLKRKK